MRFVYPGFSSVSEFAAGYHGDCGPTGLLMALHCVDPQRWPLTPDALGALVHDIQGRGDAGANGAQNVPQMDGYLHALGIAHTTVGYQQFGLGALHARLKQLADPAHRPGVLIVEWSAAGRGLHDDEPGVQYHYSAFGGIDTGVHNDGVGGGYLRGDGDSNTDNKSGPTAPILTRWDAIAAAIPIAWVEIAVPVAPPQPPQQPSAVDTALGNVKAAVAALEAAVSAAKV